MSVDDYCLGSYSLNNDCFKSMAKRNISYIKPDDPPFLKLMKKQAGYDDRNHKFDELQNKDEDFVDDEESEQPQVVVIKTGDLTAEEADIEKKRIEKEKSEAKADLNQKVVFKSKKNKDRKDTTSQSKEKVKKESNSKSKTKKLLSFNFDDDDEGEDNDS